MLYKETPPVSLPPTLPLHIFSPHPSTLHSFHQGCFLACEIHREIGSHLLCQDNAANVDKCIKEGAFAGLIPKDYLQA